MKTPTGPFTKLVLVDGDWKYPFLWDGKLLYIPDYNPLTTHGRNYRYKFRVDDITSTRLNVSNRILTETEFCLTNSKPCPNFRYDGYDYNQYCYTIPSYTTTMVAKLSVIDIINNEDQFIQFPSPAIATFPNKYGSISNMKLSVEQYEIGKWCIKTPLLTDIKDALPWWNVDGSSYFTWEMALCDNDNIYWRRECEMFGGINYPDVVFDSNEFKNPMSGVASMPPSVADSKFDDSIPKWTTWTNPEGRTSGIVPIDQYINGMRVQFIYHLHIPKYDIVHDIVLPSLYLTKEDFYKLRYQPKQYNCADIDMNYNRLNITDKTIEEVTVMTAKTSSKANIVHPIFYRTRELGLIVVHPEITENIAINLDAYKSSVTNFSIKIEGQVFHEIARVESGVVFNIKGSLLPGSKRSGSYYILNESGELITTGKYRYD